MGSSKTLDASIEPKSLDENLDNEDILEALGVEINKDDMNDITNLQNVKTSEIKVAQEVGKHKTCEDFEIFNVICQP